MKLNGKFEEAFLLAADLHREQTRKGNNTPYISHLLAVAAIALRFGADEDEAVAALLHDAVEDQGGETTLQLIEEKFGSRVAQIVVGCSDTNQTPKPAWHLRKQTYLTHLKNADKSTLLVSAADKLHNAQDCVYTHHAVEEKLWEIFSASKEDTKWYYRSLAETYALRKEEFPQLAPLFNETITAIEELLILS